jgi:multidrug efflux pump subunit AcrA (membrane-fusion protein)
MDTSVTDAGYTEDSDSRPRQPTRTLPDPPRRLGTQSPPDDWFRPEPGINGRAPAGVADHPSEYADHPSDYQQETRRTKRPITGPQRVGAILLTAVMVVGVAWYVPKVIASDTHSFTGTVTTTGISDLNFASAGRVGAVFIHQGQTVKAGQILASETSPRTIAVLNADRAAITADTAALRQAQASPAPAGQTKQAAIASAKANLAKAGAQLASDRVRRVETEIVAPSGGTVLAINGQVGETVSAGGIHNYSSQSPQAASQQPAFSLIPLGPRSSVTGKTTSSALPMIALRTSGGWLVDILVPQADIASIHTGQRATISVPAVRLSNVPGYIQGLSPSPINTSTGVAYQVAISVSGHQRATPFSGMTADVQLLG